MTSSIPNGLVALYGSDERIINNNNNIGSIAPLILKLGSTWSEWSTSWPATLPLGKIHGTH